MVPDGDAAGVGDRRAGDGDFAVVGEVADHFHEARRVLNAVTDRYLFPMRSRWFPA